MKSFFVFAVLLVGTTYALSQCEQEAANQQGMPGSFVPSCDEDGSYKDLQCHGSTGFCYCARKDGTKINEPLRGVYESCKCIRHLDEVESNMEPEGVGAFIPRCQTNGKYQKRQCWASTGTCWCVDESTGDKITEPSHEIVHCSP